ncbi:MAG: XRE family transcriptional regulator, partial [Acidobacteria bacterium]|nr:XRE family transcriptional regulator [Acidobacteriota bacterium]
EKLVELAQILGTSVDYLLTGSRAEPIPLRNTRLLERFRAIEDFPAEDQDAVLRLIDAMIIRNRVQGAIQSIQPGQ